MAEVSTCPHGLPTGKCLICATLAGGTATAGTVSPPAPGRHRRRGDVARPDVVIAPPAPGGRTGRAHVAGAVVALVAIGLVAWAIAGIVWSLLHILELAAIALLAGWIGYVVGFFRGRRSR